MRRSRRPVGVPPRASLPRSLCFLWGFRPPVPFAAVLSLFGASLYRDNRDVARGAMPIKRKKRDFALLPIAPRAILARACILVPRGLAQLSEGRRNRLRRCVYVP